MEDFIHASNYKELTIFQCGKEECVKSKAVELSKQNYHLFHYVIHGKGSIVIGGKKYRLSKGEIFFIPAQTEAKYYADHNDPWTYEWVGFGGSQVSNYINLLQLSANNPIIEDKNRVYKKYFDAIVSRYINSGYLDISSLGGLYQLFGELIYDKEGNKNVSKAFVTVQLAKDYIRNNYQFDITIEDIAKNANVTPNYLSFIFQKEEKLTTKRYLIKLRMEKAMELLKSGEYKVGEVSNKVGYPNQLHFSSEFKKYYGLSPLKYLEKEGTK